MVRHKRAVLHYRCRIRAPVTHTSNLEAKLDRVLLDQFTQVLVHAYREGDGARLGPNRDYRSRLNRGCCAQRRRIGCLQDKANISVLPRHSKKDRTVWHRPEPTRPLVRLIHSRHACAHEIVKQR